MKSKKEIEKLKLKDLDYIKGVGWLEKELQISAEHVEDVMWGMEQFKLAQYLKGIENKINEIIESRE